MFSCVVTKYSKGPVYSTQLKYTLTSVHKKIAKLYFCQLGHKCLLFVIVHLCIPAASFDAILGWHFLLFAHCQVNAM